MLNSSDHNLTDKYHSQISAFIHEASSSTETHNGHMRYTFLRDTNFLNFISESQAKRTGKREMCNRTVMENLLIPLFNAAAYHHLGIYPSAKELGSQGAGMGIENQVVNNLLLY